LSSRRDALRKTLEFLTISWSSHSLSRRKLRS
jgi:hypothetical protein